MSAARTLRVGEILLKKDQYEAGFAKNGTKMQIARVFWLLICELLVESFCKEGKAASCRGARKTVIFLQSQG